jgi:TonB family protein
MNAKIIFGINRTRVLTSMLLGMALGVPLAAQNRLYIQEPDGNFHAVLKVSGVRPYITENGQPVAAKGQRLAMKKVDEYLPIFIAIRDKDSRPTNVSVDYANVPVNNGFHFSAKFESADLLKDVFIVLEMEISNVGKKIFVYEIGQLDPRTPKSFSAELALGQYMGSGQVDVHLFVGGNEVFNSEQPAAYREEMLDRMIAKRIAAVQQAAPKPFYGSAPAYPSALRNSGLKGEVVLSMRITPRGTVVDPVVESATEPLFGEAALAAVRQCRFLPRVQNGQAVETKINMPFTFELPKEALAEKS